MIDGGVGTVTIAGSRAVRGYVPAIRYRRVWVSSTNGYRRQRRKHGYRRWPSKGLSPCGCYLRRTTRHGHQVIDQLVCREHTQRQLAMLAGQWP